MNYNFIKIPSRGGLDVNFKQHITNVCVSCMIFDIWQLQNQETLQSNLLETFSRFSDHKTC